MALIFEPKKSLNWTLQEFAGPDARDFLHRLTTVNLHRIGAGDGAMGFFLTAVGRIRAQFFLACLAESPSGDRFALEYDAGKAGDWSKALAEAIDQFTFAERQTLHAASALECLWVLDQADLPGRNELKDAIILDRGHRDFGGRWFSIWAESQILHAWREKFLPDARVVEWCELDCRRMEQVRPWVGHELTTEVMPLELGLYDGVAENKGCYPGQEVIERIITQGAPPRRLVFVEATGAPSTEAGQAEIVPTSSCSGKALALVRKNLAVVGQKLSISGLGEVTVKGCSPDAPFAQP